MTLSEIRRVLETALHGASLGVPVGWDNVPPNPPPDTLWLGVMVQHGTAEAASLGPGTGARLGRRRGAISLTIHAPAGAGPVAAEDLAQDVLGVLEGQVLSSLVLDPARSSVIEPEGDGWWRLRLELPFTAPFTY